jgi:hypothetical protein
MLHFGLQTAALVLGVLGVIVAFASHNLKRPPSAHPNLYSAHSWGAVVVVALMCVQYVVGTAAYLFPGWLLPQRKALAPLHAFLGTAVFVGGIAAMMVRRRRRRIGVHVTFVTHGGLRLHKALLLRLVILLITLMQTGIQEKATSIQVATKPDVVSGVMRIPASLHVLLILLVITLLYHHVLSAPARQAGMVAMAAAAAAAGSSLTELQLLLGSSGGQLPP